MKSFLLPLLLLVSMNALGDQNFRAYRGTANQLASGKFLYQEQHWLRFVGAKLAERVVLYQCANGQAFGRKIMRVSTNAQVPEFDLIDQRTGYKEGIKRAAKGFEVYTQLNRGKPQKAETIEATAQRLVADAGFDEFVRANWNALLARESVKLNFVVPGELDYIGFKLNWQAKTTIDGEPAQVFELAPSGLLGWIVDGIEVTYTDRERRLARFAGLSNLRDLQSKNYEVDIRFPLANANELADATQFTVAKTQALVTTCVK
jgi:hypothetical protein